MDLMDFILLDGACKVTNAPFDPFDDEHAASYREGIPICWYLHAYAYPSCALYVCIPFDDVSAMWEQSVQGLLF